MFFIEEKTLGKQNMEVVVVLCFENVLSKIFLKLFMHFVVF